MVAGLVDAETGGDAKLKSPKSYEALGVKLAWDTGGGLDATVGFEISFGPASKKPPPLRGVDVTCGAAIDDR